MALISLEIPWSDGSPITVTAEQVTAHFAISPTLTARQDGSLTFADHGRSLTHIPTGLLVTRSGRLDLRRYATERNTRPTVTRVRPDQASASRSTRTCWASRLSNDDYHHTTRRHVIVEVLRESLTGDTIICDHGVGPGGGADGRAVHGRHWLVRRVG